TRCSLPKRSVSSLRRVSSLLFTFRSTCRVVLSGGKDYGGGMRDVSTNRPDGYYECVAPAYALDSLIKSQYDILFPTDLRRFAVAKQPQPRYDIECDVQHMPSSPNYIT